MSLFDVRNVALQGLGGGAVEETVDCGMSKVDARSFIYDRCKTACSRQGYHVDPLTVGTATLPQACQPLIDKSSLACGLYMQVAYLLHPKYLHGLAFLCFALPDRSLSWLVSVVGITLIRRETTKPPQLNNTRPNINSPDGNFSFASLSATA